MRYLKMVLAVVIVFEAAQWWPRLANLPSDVAVMLAAITVLAGLMALPVTRIAAAGRRVIASLRGLGGDRWVHVLVLAIALTSLSACTRVGPGYVGIKVSMAGDARGVDSAPAVVGWNFYNPFLSSVYEYPTFVQTAVWTKSPDEGNPNNEEITFTNADQMQISVDVSLSYHLDADKVPAFYVKFRSDNLNRFTHGFLRNLARDEFNNHAGRYRIEQIMGDNAPFLLDVRTALQEAVRPIGVELDQFGIIGAPRPPDAVIEAINGKVHATQLAQQKQNELVQAQADAAKVVAAAQGEADALLIRAQSQATANRQVAASLTRELIDLRSIEKWNGALPGVTTGTVPFINVGPK